MSLHSRSAGDEHMNNDLELFLKGCVAERGCLRPQASKGGVGGYKSARILSCLIVILLGALGTESVTDCAEMPKALEFNKDK
jgi:hypothetical protein